ncbi:ParB/RepB/Spo0J family partition protein [Sphingopyxis sp.]|uniref:ParB/RepB/Spo0J family partition protein n=1 Tax=Sphingopyxis sp. TaxID=1908224 RepID=UPI002D774D20|nr:ParB N-terminal domain-containing protein [Sphingopyxis sp.]HET6523525.1 ParB N-terminal domain-containing protein [Sphingopyxis sp.]
MAKAAQKITLSPSLDIPFDRLQLSQSNVRRIKCGVSIGELAEDIARRTLLQSLNVRPLLDTAGAETGSYEIPAGGRRFRALELLVKQKRLAKDAPIPCIVQRAGEAILAEEDSYAENAVREQLHPLDQFRGMQAMVEKGAEPEDIAAHFMTTPAVVRQRLKLAAVSPKLHDVYAADAMTLEQLMAFTISDDHARQEQVWELLESSFNRSATYIRQKLTEDSVRAADKRVGFVTVEAYLEAGGSIVRDLFEADNGGWLTDPALLDRLVDARLEAEAARIGAEGWKWVDTAVELPWNATHALRRIAGTEAELTDEEAAKLAALEEEADTLSEQWSEEPDVPAEIHARLEAIDAEIGTLADRPQLFDPEEIGIAGAFVSIDPRGNLTVERGFVRPEDEPVAGEAGGEEKGSGDGGPGDRDAPAEVMGGEMTAEPDPAEEELKPLSERTVSDLTCWRTLALQDAFARDPGVAFATVLHGLVLATFYGYSHESCLQLTLHPVGFSNAPGGLRDTPPAQAIAERAEAWRARLPKSDKDVWDALLELDGDEQMALFAHCASLAVNAQAEIVPKYDNGRISKHMVERRIAHSHVLARAVGLDLVEAGWRPTASGYLGSVTKPRILADVAEARGENFAQMIDHLKKADMAREAERLLEDSGWLPEPMRTPGAEEAAVQGDATGGAAAAGASDLPPFLDDEAGTDELPIAAE